MFGFLDPLGRSEAYLLALRRCRGHLLAHYGRKAWPFLSFEAVFVYVAASEASADRDDASLGRLCASACLLLALVKLEDDVRDGASWMAKGALFAMRAPFAAALTHVDTIDPSARRELERLVREHVALEARTEPIPLEDYVAPTADAFGAAFALAATASHKAAFSAMGENVGGALCAFDCALDWDRDRACGAFNPLPDKHAVGVAFSFARESLMAARRTCVGIVGEDSLSARTLDGVLRRIDRRIVRRGSFGDAFFAPIGSHIESSPAAETRDKLWFCCQMVAGTLIDAINRPSAPSVDVCGTNPPAA